MIHVLGLVDWQLFTTLTFKQAQLPERVRLAMAFGWLRGIAKAAHVHFKLELIWCLRLEHGELGGRLHFHALVGGLPERFPRSIRSRMQAKNSWEAFGGGMARVREFNSALSGEDYMLKDDKWLLQRGADAYESAKFGSSTCQLMFSETGWLAAGARVGRLVEPSGFVSRDSRVRPAVLHRRNPLAHPYDTTKR